MNFANPLALLLLMLPLVLAYAEVLNRGRRLVLPLDHGTAPRAVRRRLAAALLLGTRLLPALATAAAILALAEPRVRRLQPTSRPMTNVEFCLDVSGSMEASIDETQRPLQAPVGERRYDLAMKQVKEFIRGRPGDSFGLTVFGRDVVRWAPVTGEPELILGSEPFLDPAKLSDSFSGRTDIAGALRAGAATLLTQGAPDNLLVLISDGEDNVELSPAVAQTLAESWRAANIKLCVIIVGHDNVPDRLQLMAEATGGMSASAASPHALPRAFRQLDALQPFVREEAEPVDLPFAAPFLVVGLALACGCLVSLAGMRYTPW
jgi:Ca-activated chloride channel family protein